MLMCIDVMLPFAEKASDERGKIDLFNSIKYSTYNHPYGNMPTISPIKREA